MNGTEKSGTIDYRLDKNEEAIRDQWQVLNDIRDSLSEIKASLAEMKSAIGKVDGLEKRIETLQLRVESLERWRTYLFGGWAVIAFIGYIAWDYYKANRH